MPLLCSASASLTGFALRLLLHTRSTARNAASRPCSLPPLFSLSKIRTSSITHMREAARKMFFCLLCFSVCSVRTCSIHGRMVYGCVLPILHCSHLLLSLSCLFYSSLWDCPLHSPHCRLRDPGYPVQRLQYGHTRNKPNANLVWQQYSNG